MGEDLDQNPSRAQTRLRAAGKWLSWRVLPKTWYQDLLARSKARDFRSGAFMEPEMDLIPYLLEPAGTAIDVGANHGMWTLAFSERAGPEGRVLSFEPVPFTFGSLRNLTDRLGLDNVQLFQLGCSDESGRFEMVVPQQGAGASDSLQAYLADRRVDSDHEYSESISCEIVRLDDMVANLERVDIIKLDIEGAEMKALMGARQSLVRHRPAIVCEVDREFMAGFGQTPGDIHRFIESIGYSAHLYRSEDSSLMPLDSLDSVLHANLVFLTPERFERLESLIS